MSRLQVDLIDSPITQEQLHAIDQGGATLMVGADSPEALEKVMPLLKDMSTHVFPMGGLGAGHTMKTLNNYVSVGSIIALNDALVSTTTSTLRKLQDWTSCNATCNAIRLRQLLTTSTGHRSEARS